MRYAVALMFLMLADAVSTLGLLRCGLATEANPLMALVIGWSWIGFVVGKGALGFLAGLVLMRSPKAARVVALLYVCILLWHIVGWVTT